MDGWKSFKFAVLSGRLWSNVVNTSDGIDPALINKERNFHKFSGLSFVCLLGS